MSLFALLRRIRFRTLLRMYRGDADYQRFRVISQGWPFLVRCRLRPDYQFKVRVRNELHRPGSMR